MKNLSKRNDPGKYEEKWSRYWLRKKTFASVPDNRKPYSIVIPPPNITGALHMGHALNNVLQDIVIRHYKIKGFNTMWQPGTDHGGIATQNVVERQLLKEEGKTRTDLGREEFLRRMHKWKEESGGTIISQLKRLGFGCDWDRIRFTMDEQCSKAVNEAFCRLFNKGLIYRGEYMINFCPRCRTALSDIEVENEEKSAKLWYIKYPLKDSPGSFIRVATTRPETMLGDTAVAVNPEDERYKDIIGKRVIVPLINREIRVISDEFVDPGFGTGIVKVTPAHDPNDFEIGTRHDLEIVKVINEKARMSEEAGEFQGMDRFECRKEIVKKLTELTLLEKEEDYTHSPALCYRCSTLVEPLISKQWFLKMKKIASRALEASSEKKVGFVPESWEKPYLHWLENIHDWCISRQIWWGHRIPVYYCENNNCEPFAAARHPGSCSSCGGGVRRDEDVLDTWFSSALWPFSTMGWPEKSEDLKYYYPTKVLVTGHEILYLWVARMVMMGLEMIGEVPFETVYIHGMIRDEKGEKMSKSKGNVIDPIDIIEKCGADALRFSLAKSAVPGRDIQLSEEDFTEARNFMNKLHNAARLILGGLEIKELEIPPADDMDIADKWILYELERFTKEIESSYEQFNNARSCRLIYEFVWNYFCDWYLELAKLRLYAEGKNKKTAQKVLVYVFIRILSIMHPVTPFITSEIWEYFRNQLENLKGETPLDFNPAAISVPDISEEKVSDMRSVMEIISAVRNIRGEVNISPGQKIDIGVKASEKDEKILNRHGSYIKQLADVENIEAGKDISKQASDALALVGSMTVFVRIPEALKEKEFNRIEKRINEVKGVIENYRKKLNNRDFLKKAPEKVVRNTRKKAREYQDELEKLEKNIGEKIL